MTWHAACAALLAMLALVGCSGGTGDQETVTIGDETFRLEVARDDAARAQGLMHRTEIAPDGGMIFLFPRPEVLNFWMVNCLVDMDVIYLDAQGRVTATYTMKVRPPKRADETQLDYERRMRLDSYSSRLPAQFVIELAAGSVDRLGIRVDDKIELDTERLRRAAKD